MCIILRGGWTLSKVEKTYFRFEKAGDQYLGRILSGLSIHSSEFAVLPPLFRCQTHQDLVLVDRVLNACFPRFQEKMRGVLTNVLASVVFHVEWLRSRLPAQHIWFSSALFAGFDVSALKKLVHCGMASPGDVLQPTGIPAHVTTKLKIDQLSTSQDKIFSALQDLRQDLQREVREGMNDFAVSQGHITLDSVSNLLSSKLDEKLGALLSQCKGTFNQASQSQPDNDAVPVHGRSSRKLHFWGGCFHAVPEDFVLPTTCSTQQAFLLWNCGNVEGSSSIENAATNGSGRQEWEKKV